ncbi:MAG: hypothetical protein RIF41_03330 [Polyangiaceae bacterium]
MSTPLNTVKERFESKEKLVAAVEKLMTEDLWVPRLSSDRGGNKGVSQISNAKLLRLHDALSTAKDQFGTRAKLIDAILELDKRTKDAGYRTRLEAYPVPRLLDMHQSSARRAKKSKKA